MMPSPPRSSFVVVHSGFAFVFLECGFNGPSQAADTDEFRGWAMRWSIAQIEFLFRLRSSAATTDEPLTNARQTIVDGSHAQYGKLGDQRPLATFMDQMTSQADLGRFLASTRTSSGAGALRRTRRCKRGGPMRLGPGSSTNGVRNQTRVSPGLSLIHI